MQIGERWECMGMLKPLRDKTEGTYDTRCNL